MSWLRNLRAIPHPSRCHLFPPPTTSGTTSRGAEHTTKQQSINPYHSLSPRFSHDIDGIVLVLFREIVPTPARHPGRLLLVAWRVVVENHRRVVVRFCSRPNRSPATRADNERACNPKLDFRAMGIILLCVSKMAALVGQLSPIR